MGQKRDQKTELHNAILSLLQDHPQGLTRGEILKNLDITINYKTLQRRLSELVAQKSLTKAGNRRTTRYCLYDSKGLLKGQNPRIFTPKSLKTLSYLEKPVYSREKSSYNSGFLEKYVPNKSNYVPKALRQKLTLSGQRFDSELQAGTYAQQIAQRLLIDLSYNSSRLEGNTYSLLDTKKLLEEGVASQDKCSEDSVMILNHKEAILFLVENASRIDINPFTIFNLHHLLSQDLLPNPEASGTIRNVEVSIGKSTYKPLNNPHRLKEIFELLLIKAQKISNPFEQSFFLLLHLSYLQAFEDVNKRTARLTCNIPFIKNNLCPLGFIDVPQDDYTTALLLFYETNNLTPFLELFVWAYLRSCEQYKVVKESVGDIDPFRIQYRYQRKEVMGQIIRNNLHGPALEKHIISYCQNNAIEDHDKFLAMARAALMSLHAGTIIGLGITEAQLENWLRGFTQN